MHFSFILPGAIADESKSELARWALDAGFTAVDTEVEWSDQDIRVIRDQGLNLGPMRIRASLADSDLATRERAVVSACAALDRAASLGISTVWTLARNFRNDRSQSDNYGAALETLPSVVAHAESLGIRIAIENCPFAGQNPICTPEAWDALFAAIPSDTLGICFDPSHCLWQGIDIRRAIREYGQRFLHVHAKDTEIRSEGLFRFGVEGPVLVNSQQADGTVKNGWWRHRLPGLGGVDWNNFVTGLADTGYDGPLTIEHEDPLWSGSPERVRRGLAQGCAYLSALVP
jgi:sugar phosphate isomerase/epimerase